MIPARLYTWEGLQGTSVNLLLAVFPWEKLSEPSNFG